MAITSSCSQERVKICKQREWHIEMNGDGAAGLLTIMLAGEPCSRLVASRTRARVGDVPVAGFGSGLQP